MAKALEGSITIGFKQPELLVSIDESRGIQYKGSRKKLYEEKKYDVCSSADQQWIPDNIVCRIGCPINTDARLYSLAISEGKNQLAYLLARQNNPFVSVLGKVCNAPCEPVCQRAKIDAPVTLRALKGFAVEKNKFSTGEVYEWLKTRMSDVEPAQKDNPPSIAIVGAGPAGLSAAHDLALMGYKVKVFESSKKPGGMLNAIPKFKLPDESIKSDIDGIRYLGVKIETNKTCGKDFDVDGLLKEYDAVLLAIGLQQGRVPAIPGNELDGVLHGVEFLMQAASGNKGGVELGNKVVILGGGNVAVDIARTAVRLGGKKTKVYVVCAEVAKGSKSSGGNEMPADASEIFDAKQEGVVFYDSMAPEEIVGGPDGVKGVKIREVDDTVYDEKGRLCPVYKNTKARMLEADTVILALGQQLDPSFAGGKKDIKIGRDGLLKVDANSAMSSQKGVFACGDMSKSGYIVDAVASGQKAAQSIHQYLGGSGSLGLDSVREMKPVHYHKKEDTWAVRCSIWEGLPPMLSPKKRKRSMELVEGSYASFEAKRQGQRCIDCAITPVVSPYHPCTLCGGCADACPTECISLKFMNKADFNGLHREIDGADGEGPWVSLVIDDTECIHCGMCAEACGEDSIHMLRYEEVCR